MKQVRAHFVGAPFFVPASTGSLQERFAATGYNTGNLLIGDAAARLLDIDIVSSGTMVDIRNLKDTIDLLVIPAANFLSPVMELSWLLPIVEGTNHPILMVGVGAQFPTTRIADAQLPETTLKLMLAISDRSQSISVRGQFTADVLAKFGIKNTRVTGCPSLFRLGKEKLSIRTPSPDSFEPVFNGSSNVLKHASSADEARKAELKLLRLAMELEAPYVLQNEVPEMQIAARDKKGAEGCKATLHNLGADIELDHYLKYIMEHGKTFFRADRWAEFIARHDIVIGTRFHGNIIALSQGIPAAFVAHDSRTIELCEALLIPFIGLKQFADTDLRQIVEQLDFSKMEKHFPAARKNLASFFEENQVPHRLQADAENEIKKAAQSIAGRFVQVQDAENEDASVRGSYEPLPDSILQLTQVEMDKLSAIPGVLDELKNIHSTFKDAIAEIDSAHNLEAIFQARGTKMPKEAINMKKEGLSFARQFKPLSQDVLDFGGLSPLQRGSPWSVIAFIQPTTSQQYAGIISKRTEFKIGKNQFTFWLKNGSISVEADTQGGTSGLVPPLNRWSYVGAASSSHQTTIYLGVDGEISFEHRKGIVTGTAEGQLPLTIGKLGGNFPGAIAFVWLYAKALPNAVMRDLCAGTLAPADVKGLAFGWTAMGLGEVDVVSGSAPNVIGTKLISLGDLRPKFSTAKPPKPVIASDAKQADRKNPKPKRGLRKVISKLATCWEGIQRGLVR